MLQGPFTIDNAPPPDDGAADVSGADPTAADVGAAQAPPGGGPTAEHAAAFTEGENVLWRLGQWAADRTGYEGSDNYGASYDQMERGLRAVFPDLAKELDFILGFFWQWLWPWPRQSELSAWRLAVRRLELAARQRGHSGLLFTWRAHDVSGAEPPPGAPALPPFVQAGAQDLGGMLRLHADFIAAGLGRSRVAARPLPAPSSAPSVDAPTAAAQRTAVLLGEASAAHRRGDDIRPVLDKALAQLAPAYEEFAGSGVFSPEARAALSDVLARVRTLADAVSPLHPALALWSGLPPQTRVVAGVGAGVLGAFGLYLATRSPRPSRGGRH